MDQIVETTGSGEQSGRITSWRDFGDRIRATMAMAASHTADMTMVDVDFAHWPLGERSVMEAFHQWGMLSKGTHCQLLAATYDAFPRLHPRWVAWRATWAHRVRCYQAPEELVSSLAPMLVLHGQIGLKLNESLHGTGVWTRDEGVLRTWLAEFDANLQRSHEALPPTTLGL